MEKQFEHYYGNIVRTIYLIVAVLMILLTPFYANRLPIPEMYSILGILILSIFAGFTNPLSKLFIWANFIISVGLLFAFGRETLVAYHTWGTDIFFIGNMIIGLLSVFAVYFSGKTLRGNILSSN